LVEHILKTKEPSTVWTWLNKAEYKTKQKVEKRATKKNEDVLTSKKKQQTNPYITQCLFGQVT
jgi:hypothetical protein